MKKQTILTFMAIVAILSFVSCNKYKSGTVTLKTQDDSLNYVLGLTNGYGIKENLFRNDSSEQAFTSLINAMDNAYNKDYSKKGEAYKTGIQLGKGFNQQKVVGLMGDSTIKFNEELVKQGLVNALNGFKEGMTTQQAQEYVQRVMMKIQMERQKAMMTQQPQPAAPSAPQQAAPQKGK